PGESPSEKIAAPPPAPARALQTISGKLEHAKRNHAHRPIVLSWEDAETIKTVLQVAAHLQAEPAYCLLGRLVVLACQFFEVLGNTYDARAVLNPVRGCVAVFRCIFGQRCTDRLVGIVDCCGPLRWHIAIDNSAIGIFHSL